MGRAVEYLREQDGRVSGLLLASGVRVFFPPHLSDDLQRVVRPGDRIRAYGELGRDGNVRAYAIENLDTGYLIEEVPPARERGERSIERRADTRRDAVQRDEPRRGDARRENTRREEARRGGDRALSLAEASAVTLRIADVERSRGGRLQRLVLSDGTEVRVPGRLRSALEAAGLDLRRGDRIRAELRRSRSGALHLERVWVDGRAIEEAPRGRRGRGSGR